MPIASADWHGVSERDAGKGRGDRLPCAPCLPRSVSARRPAARSVGGGAEDRRSAGWTLRRARIAAVIMAAVVVGISYAPFRTGKKTQQRDHVDHRHPSTTTTTQPVPPRADRATASPSAITTSADCPPTSRPPSTSRRGPSAPAMTIDPSKTYTATVTTDVGAFTINLDPARRPTTVNNFVFLASQHFYDCIIFHRVIPSFVDQTGDPTGTGEGGPGYQFADELPKGSHLSTRWARWPWPTRGPQHQRQPVLHRDRHRGGDPGRPATRCSAR